MQPDLNLRRQRLAARLSHMVTAKPLGHNIYTHIVIPSDACLSLGGRPLALVPKGSGKSQNRALVCDGQVEQECRSRMVEISLGQVGFQPGPGSSVARAPAASAGVPGSIPGWDVLAFFPSC